MLGRETGEAIRSFGTKHRIVGSFTVGTALAPDTTVKLSQSDLSYFSFSDGLYIYGEGSLRGTDDEISLELTTGSSGEIIDWDMYMYDPNMPYGDLSNAYASSTSTSATFARLLPCYYDEADFFTTASGSGGGQWFSGAMHFASASTLTIAAEVPLPASFPLMLAGFGGLWALRRRVRKD